MGTLKDELRKARVELAIIQHEAPQCPPNARDVSVEGLYHAYADMCENVRVKDPRGEWIRYEAENFPYLVKLEFWNAKLKRWLEASASVVIRQLKEKSFDYTRYRVGDQSRARTLFWITGIIDSPDCIHENNKAGMSDKEVYVMRYKRQNPGEAEVKVVLTAQRRDGKVVSSSFWTDQDWLRKSLKHPPIYIRPNSKGCRCR